MFILDLAPNERLYEYVISQLTSYGLDTMTMVNVPLHNVKDYGKYAARGYVTINSLEIAGLDGYCDEFVFDLIDNKQKLITQYNKDSLFIKDIVEIGFEPEYVVTGYYDMSTYNPYVKDMIVDVFKPAVYDRSRWYEPKDFLFRFFIDADYNMYLPTRHMYIGNINGGKLHRLMFANSVAATLSQPKDSLLTGAVPSIADYLYYPNVVEAERKIIEYKWRIYNELKDMDAERYKQIHIGYTNKLFEIGYLPLSIIKEVTAGVYL